MEITYEALVKNLDQMRDIFRKISKKTKPSASDFTIREEFDKMSEFYHQHKRLFTEEQQDVLERRYLTIDSAMFNLVFSSH